MPGADPVAGPGSADRGGPGADLPWTLQAASGVVSVEALVEAVVVAGRTELTPGLRVGLVLCISLKWLFAWRVLHRSAGAALGLLMLEGTTIVAAFGATAASGGARVALGVTAALVIALLSASLHAFPTASLPRGYDSR